jgi:hypothetical protein
MKGLSDDQVLRLLNLVSAVLDGELSPAVVDAGFTRRELRALQRKMDRMAWGTHQVGTS